MIALVVIGIVASVAVPWYAKVRRDVRVKQARTDLEILSAGILQLAWDTGKWPGGDAGSSVVVPALRARGVTRLDAVIISHGDADHSGGFDSVLEAFGVERVFAPAGTALAGPQSSPCLAGEGWVRDKTSERVPITLGCAVFWEKDEWHESGTNTGLIAIVIESEFLNPSEFMPLK